MLHSWVFKYLIQICTGTHRSVLYQFNSILYHIRMWTLATIYVDWLNVFSIWCLEISCSFFSFFIIKKVQGEQVGPKAACGVRRNAFFSFINCDCSGHSYWLLWGLWLFSFRHCCCLSMCCKFLSLLPLILYSLKIK